MTLVPERATPSAEAALPQWMHPPREEGWYAEDLDTLHDAPAHTELIDGNLAFTMSPQRFWHMQVMRALANALTRQAPDDITIALDMTVVLDRRNRPEPDVLAAAARVGDDRTAFDAAEVRLAVEVVSPESAFRDRHVKPAKYAKAGIGAYWRVEDEDGAPVVHAFELDETTGGYAPSGVFRGTLKLPHPFDIRLDLDRLIDTAGMA